MHGAGKGSWWILFNFCDAFDSLVAHAFIWFTIPALGWTPFHAENLDWWQLVPRSSTFLKCYFFQKLFTWTFSSFAMWTEPAIIFQSFHLRQHRRELEEIQFCHQKLSIKKPRGKLNCHERQLFDSIFFIGLFSTALIHLMELSILKPSWTQRRWLKEQEDKFFGSVASGLVNKLLLGDVFRIILCNWVLSGVGKSSRRCLIRLAEVATTKCNFKKPIWVLNVH